MVTSIHQPNLQQKEIEELQRRPTVEEVQLDTVMDAVAESAVEAPQEELFEDLRLEGKDPMQEAERVRDVLLRALPKKAETRQAVTVTPAPSRPQ